MSLQFIEGGAGTGKTTTVIARLSEHLVQTPLVDHQRVLALTKMHGSRRRVGDRLRSVAGIKGRFDSTTIDSFAACIVHRWRSLARALQGAAAPSEGDFNAICELAGRMLEESGVQKWVAKTFPIVIVDELQDSKGGQLRLLQALSARCVCIAAGDPFQDLDGDAACASVEWARGQAAPTVLTTTHRTNTQGLLAAATSLREGQAVAAASGFSIVGVDAYGLGAWEAALKIAKWWKLGSIAVITPVTAGRSPFVRQLVERVSSGPIGQQRPIGPFRLFWESGQEDRVARICADVGLPEDDDERIATDALKLADAGHVRALRDWASQQRRLLGLRDFKVGEVREVIRRLVQQSSNQSHREESRLAAMSVHQAKNREFDRVIVLWPYEVSGNDERKRRLAYNAITRARHEAHVIVQKKARVTDVPFVPGSAGIAAGAPRRRRRANRPEEPA